MTSILWQKRNSADAPTVVRHGREKAVRASTASLLEIASVVGLVTRGQHEVQLGDIRKLDSSNWCGRVLRAASAPGVPRVGDLVEFAESDVLSVHLPEDGEQ